MKQSQVRIQEIQEKLQAIGAGSPTATATTSPMVELMPNQPLPPPSFQGERSPQPSMPLTRSSPPVGSYSASGQGQTDLAAYARVLDQRSSHYVQQWQQPPGTAAESGSPYRTGFPGPAPYPHSPTQPSAQRQGQQQGQGQQQIEHLRSELTQRLEIQVEQINQLSMAQETALLELKALVDRAEHELKTLVFDHDLPPTMELALPGFHCEAAAVPQVQRDGNGRWVLTSRAVDLYKAEMADMLRHRATSGRSPAGRSRTRGRHRGRSPSVLDLIARAGVALGQSFGLMSTASTARSIAPPGSTSEGGSLGLQEGLVWLVGAIATRIALNALLGSAPALWGPAILLLLVPGAIALYKAVTSPQTGFLWGYRLFLVMLGLLLGGRFM